MIEVLSVARQRMPRALFALPGEVLDDIHERLRRIALELSVASADGLCRAGVVKEYVVMEIQ